MVFKFNSTTCIFLIYFDFEKTIELYGAKNPFKFQLPVALPTPFLFHPHPF